MDASQTILLLALKSSSAILSAIGSLTVMITIIINWKKRALMFQLFVGMSLFDLISCAAMLMGYWSISSGGLLCQLQAVLLQTGLVASVLYSVALAISMKLVVVFEYDSKRMTIIHCCMHVGIVLLSVAVGTAPLVMNQIEPIYENDDLWCWITDDHYGYQLGFLYGPVWALFLMVNLPIYLSVYNQLSAKSLPSKKLKTLKHNYVQSVIFYILAFVITWIPATVNAVYTSVTGSKNFVTVVLVAFFLPMVGLLNFVACYNSVLSKIFSSVTSCRRDDGGDGTDKESDLTRSQFFFDCSKGDKKWARETRSMDMFNADLADLQYDSMDLTFTCLDDAKTKNAISIDNGAISPKSPLFFVPPPAAFSRN